MARVTTKNIHFIQEELLKWYLEYGRKLPWRKGGLSNYRLIIAETLLQRTKAETVAKYYLQFLIEFPNWKSLANAEAEKIEHKLKPLGLYKQRAYRLKSLGIEMEIRNGRLTKNREELESIPFMGQYIVNAIELLVFHKPSPLIDVNMARFLERYFGERKLADIRYDPYLQQLSFKVVNHEMAKEINWAILDFAALICKARNPLCHQCPLQNDCFFTKRNIVS